jgi:thiamine-monophosphate kinase
MNFWTTAMTGANNSDGSGEFDLIRRYFAPLAGGFAGSLGLEDDAALISPEPGCELVVTADAIVCGVHFLADDPPGDVAKKLLRVNLSDLAAMGADPLAYVLTTAWPRNLQETWIAAFAQGLADDQTRFGIHLAGGDTVSTDGPATFSLTAMGQVPAGQALTRSGAEPGHAVLVSGTIGNAGAGLRVLQGQCDDVQDPDERDFLIRCYRLPEPQLALGRALRGSAAAAIDISDGLLADLGHICETSGVGAEIDLTAVPMTAAARRCLEPVAAVSAGDDYELLITALPASLESLMALAREVGIELSAIGRITEGGGIVLRDDKGRVVQAPSAGYQHHI